MSTYCGDQVAMRLYLAQQKTMTQVSKLIIDTTAVVRYSVPFFFAPIICRSGLVVKFVLAMHEPRVRFTAATSFCHVYLRFAPPSLSHLPAFLLLYIDCNASPQRSILLKSPYAVKMFHPRRQTLLWTNVRFREANTLSV
jgi:hypothetical protein